MDDSEILEREPEAPPVEETSEEITTPPKTAAETQLNNEGLSVLREMVRQHASHNQQMEVISESRALSEYALNGEVTEQNLTDYLHSKGSLFGEQSKEIAHELMQVENRLILPFIAELTSHPALTHEQKNNAAVAAREAFYGMILSGHLSAERILSIVSGKIHFRDVPNGEVRDEHKATKNMASYIGWDQANHCFNIYLYKEFFKNSSADMAFLFRHEFSHPAGLSIWGKRFLDFRAAALNPEANYQHFSDVPELQRVLYLVANPELAKPFFRQYIIDLLEAAEKAENSAQKSHFQQRAAIEIVADLGAHFFEGSGSLGVLLNLRTRYLKNKDPQEFVVMCCRLEGVKDEEELLARYQITKEMTPDEVVGRLCQSERLQGLFQTSQIWQERLSDRLAAPEPLFANTTRRGEKLVKLTEEFEEDELQSFSEVEEFAATPAAQYKHSQSAGTGQESLGNALMDIWNLFTGGKKTA